MAAAKKSHKKSDAKKSKAKSGTKDRKKDRKAVDSKVEPKGRGDAEKDNAAKKGTTTNKAKKSKKATTTKSRPTKAAMTSPRAKVGEADDAALEKIAAKAARSAERAAMRTETAAKPSPATAVRSPASGPAPSPRPVVRRSGLATPAPAAEVPNTVQRSDEHARATSTASRAHLYRLAQRLDIPGRSTMTRDELVQALQKANDKAIARARED